LKAEIKRGYSVAWCWRTSSGKEEKLDERWVYENFASYGGYLERVISSSASKYPGKYRHVPKGSAAVLPSVSGPESHGSTRAFGLAGGAVPGFEHQGSGQWCASYGLASALRHEGFGDYAEYILEHKDDFFVANPLDKAAKLLKEKGGWADPVRLPNHDPITDRSKDITIVQLCDADGDNTHIVSTVGDWIFDSRQFDKMDLSPENLDRACVGFHHVSRAYRLVPGKKLRKRKRVD